MNAIPPNRMTPAERLDEVAAILAAGIARLTARNAAHSQADKSTREKVLISTSPLPSASMDKKTRRGERL
ncbi:MAG: hypothetical protein H7840_18185 [Alphaproteobacteria bacterium]